MVAALTLGALSGVGLGSRAKADETTVSEDTLRTGWDPNEPSLSPTNVTASNFGSLFSTQLDGQIYAQPLVAAGTLIVATENDEVYGLDPATGAIRWTHNVGPARPASAIGCGDLTPNLGVTSTPVYDPASNAVYFTAKVNDGPDAAAPALVHVRSRPGHRGGTCRVPGNDRRRAEQRSDHAVRPVHRRISARACFCSAA